MRLRLIKVALRKNWLHFFLPLTMLYIVLPLIGYTVFLQSDIDRSMHSIVFAAQALLPASCILLPMAHFIIWFYPLGNEALIAASPNHHCCVGEILYFYLGIAIVLFPALLIFFQFYGSFWIEFIRLYAQCIFAISSYYVCSVFWGNVTLGALPIVIYLFLCICFNDIAKYNILSILDPHNLAEYACLKKYMFIYIVSFCLIAMGAVIERRKTGIEVK